MPLFLKTIALKEILSNEVWYEEFLDYKIVIGQIPSNEDAIAMINKPMLADILLQSSLKMIAYSEVIYAEL